MQWNSCFALLHRSLTQCNSFSLSVAEDKKNKKLLPPMMLQALEYPDLHAQFENTFCELISQADSSSFGEVTNCQIDFTYSLADSTGQHYHGGSTNNGDEAADYEGTMKGEFDLSHVLKGDDNAITLQNRINVMGNCFKDTYNLVHDESPYTINGVTLQQEIDVPEDDDDDKSAAVLKFDYRLKYRIWSRLNINFGCNKCMPDDRKFMPPLAMSRLTMGEHQAFEATFGNCLRESGVWALHKVNNARIRFAYTGNPDDASASQLIPGHERSGPLCRFPGVMSRRKGRVVTVCIF